MAQDEGIGKVAGRWLRSRITEWTTTDKRTREDADLAADRAERDAKDHAVEEAILTAVPGLRRMKERQEAHEAARDAEREQRRRDELAARPRADLDLRVEGEFAGQGSGVVAVLLDVRPPEPVEDDGEDSWVDPDPYADRPTLLVELTVLDDGALVVGSRPFAAWRFQVPGFTGDGTYDLAAIAAERERANASPDYVDWDLVFAGGEDEPYYFHTDSGLGTVTVADDHTRLDVAMRVTSASGDLTVTAALRLR